MIRQLTDRERATLNLEQPGARITADLQAENNRWENLRHWAITDRVRTAQARARHRRTMEEIEAAVEARVTRMLGYSPHAAAHALRKGSA